MRFGEKQTDRPIRWGMIGGGINSQIGYIHRSAALRDFNFDLVNSGSAAIEYIRSKPRPDLLIIDLDIGGGISGLAILRALRRDGYGPEDLTVMFVGSAKDKETIIKCQALKAVDYILKPINPMYVRTRVEIVLNKNFLFA